MPTQVSNRKKVVQRIEFDTRPIVTVLLDDNDEPIDLTDATVTISVAFTFPHQGYYTSPRDQIITDQPCVVDPDQGTNPGRVTYFPGTEANVDALTPPGSFSFQYNITKPDLTLWIVPDDYYFPMTIRARVGGRAYNQSP